MFFLAESEHSFCQNISFCNKFISKWKISSNPQPNAQRLARIQEPFAAQQWILLLLQQKAFSWSRRSSSVTHTCFACFWFNPQWPHGMMFDKINTSLAELLWIKWILLCIWGKFSWFLHPVVIHFQELVGYTVNSILTEVFFAKTLTLGMGKERKVNITQICWLDLEQRIKV